MIYIVKIKDKEGIILKISGFRVELSEYALAFFNIRFLTMFIYFVFEGGVLVYHTNLYQLYSNCSMEARSTMPRVTYLVDTSSLYDVILKSWGR